MAKSATSVDETEWRRLLVVDDEEIVLVALRETLMRAGYEVTATNDAAEALEALRTTRFAVIITDQQMPRMTGLEFLAQAKVLRPEATRILITAVLNLGTVIEAINQGEIYRFIVKPWLREEFLGAITSAVERYRLVSGHAIQRSRADEAVHERDSLLLRLRQTEEQRDAARRHATLERDRTRALAQAMLNRYDVTLGDRTRRVATLCRALGAKAGLAQADQEALEDAGWYHDLGCLGMESGLAGIRLGVLKNLDAGQRREWEAHPRRSAELLAEVGFSADVRAAVEAHHERHDGSGSPQGLCGDSIPRLGRLLAVAVAYVEGGSDRRAALARIQESAGTAFDLESVRCLEQTVAELESAVPMPV
jgi:response regulator RpfG family c-di-GMP phosphodiesterase